VTDDGLATIPTRGRNIFLHPQDVNNGCGSYPVDTKKHCTQHGDSALSSAVGLHLGVVLQAGYLHDLLIPSASTHLPSTNIPVNMLYKPFTLATVTLTCTFLH
jgi:hypothetical protein